MESRTDDVAARLLRCPVGCAFLLTIERDEVPIGLAVTPPQAFARAAIALNALNPWSADFERTIAAALSRGADLASLAHAVVTHPQSRWWTAPMDPTRQVLVTRDVIPDLLPTRRRLTPFGSAYMPKQRCRARRPSRLSAGRILRATSQWNGASPPRSVAQYACLDTVIASGVGDWGASDFAPQIRSRDRRIRPRLRGLRPGGLARALRLLSTRQSAS